MNVALNYNDDLATVKSKIGSLGSRYTVSVFDVKNENDNSILICSGNPIWIKYDGQKGAVAPLAVLSHTISGGSISVTENADGIHPLWGTFSISFENQVAWNIPFDASAAEMTAALDELPNIGGLRVSVDEIGKITNGIDSATITKIGRLLNSQIHPTTYGDLPMLVWDESNSYLSHKDDGQYRPQVFIREQMKGTRGNNRQDGAI